MFIKDWGGLAGSVFELLWAHLRVKDAEANVEDMEEPRSDVIAIVETLKMRLMIYTAFLCLIPMREMNILNCQKLNKHI